MIRPHGLEMSHSPQRSSEVCAPVDSALKGQLFPRNRECRVDSLLIGPVGPGWKSVYCSRYRLCSVRFLRQERVGQSLRQLSVTTVCVGTRFVGEWCSV